VNDVSISEFHYFTFLAFENGKVFFCGKNKAKADTSTGTADETRPRSREYE
jgi:hypothetical protein